MNRLLIGCIFTLTANAVHAQVEAVQMPPTIPPRAEYVLQKVSEADALCAQVPLVVPTEVASGVSGNDGLPVKRITRRPVALCAYGEDSKTWHVIHVHIESPVPKEYIFCVKTAPTLEERRRCVLPYHVMTPDYQTEHLRGYGIVRLIFNVFAEKVTQVKHGDETHGLRSRGEKLTVYRSRHLWLDDDALASGDVDRIVATARAINYTPYHPDFKDDQLVDIGAEFLFTKVLGAKQELGFDPARSSSVRSHAFSGRTIAEVVPWEIPLSLAVIEQMDDKTFVADKKSAADAVLIEYALNREDAFKWSQSGANAIGQLQFTDSGGDGTYSAMVREYPEANLNPDFQVGARDVGNVLKAAIVLIDHEVSMFPESKVRFARNPKLGGAIPVAAYNGGPRAGRALHSWLKKNRVNIERKNVRLPSSFSVSKVEQCPCMNRTTKKIIKKEGTIVRYVANTETPGYLVKYLFLLNYLSDLDLERP